MVPTPGMAATVLTWVPCPAPGQVPSSVAVAGGEGVSTNSHHSPRPTEAWQPGPPLVMRTGEVGSQALPQSTHQPVFVSSCHEDFGSRAQPSQQGLPGPPAFPVPGGSKDWTTPSPAADLRKPRGMGMGIG